MFDSCPIGMGVWSFAEFLYLLSLSSCSVLLTCIVSLSSCDKASGGHESVDHTLLELGIADFGAEERKELVQIKVLPSLGRSRSCDSPSRDLSLPCPSVA